MSSYLPLKNKQRKHLIARTTKELLASKWKFDSIVCTGLSGTLIASQVAIELNKNLIIIRKGETSHGEAIEYDCFPEQYIIIDDFMETGATIKRVHRKMKSEFDDETFCAGVYFYDIKQKRLRLCSKD